MRLLLDTHVFLWARIDPSKLRPAVRDAVADFSNDVYVSSIAIWEITVKQSLGKLQFLLPPPSVVEAWIRSAGFRELPFSAQHAAAVASLPPIHADPFDRAMLAQAAVESLTFVTADARALQYPVASLAAR